MHKVCVNDVNSWLSEKVKSNSVNFFFRSENPDLSEREVGSGWGATEVDEFGFAVREKHGLCLEERCDVQDDAVRGGGGRGRSALEFDPCQVL